MKELKTDSAAQLKAKETIVVREEPGEVDSAAAVCVESAQADNVEIVEAPSKSFPEPAPDLGARYDVLDFVGSGGMGTVWKVYDKELKETFAIKVLKPELLSDETSVKRFEKEANLAIDLTHANIAAIFGPGQDTSGRPFIIMRYVEGESLAELLYMEGPMEEERALDIFWQIYAALKHSHMKGIVHRDIKPSNIIITRTDSGADLVQLVDFGISKSIHEEVSKTQALTKAVDVFGSPRYMSPEQFLGQEVGPETDMYSLGCVLYEMLTGAPPFTDDNPVQLVLKHLQTAPKFETIPARYHLLLFYLLQKDPKQRSRSTSDLEGITSEAVTTVYDRNEIDATVIFTVLSFPFFLSVLTIVLNDKTILIAVQSTILVCTLFFHLLIKLLRFDSSGIYKRLEHGQIASSLAVFNSLATLLCAILLPLGSSVIAGSLCLITCALLLQIPSRRSYLMSAQEQIEKYFNSDSGANMRGKAFILFMHSFRLAFVAFMSLMYAFPFSLLKSETSLPFCLAVLGPIMLVTVCSNYSLGFIEFKYKFENSRLKHLAINQFTKKQLIRKFASLTLSGLLASAVGATLSLWIGPELQKQGLLPKTSPRMEKSKNP